MQRYRIDQGKYCIDVKVKDWMQLFDSRDPAPFHERDLDDDASAYILNSMLEIPKKAPVKIVLSLPRLGRLPVDEELVRGAIQQYFAYQEELTGVRIRERLREGYAALFIGVTCLSTFVFLAHLIGTMGKSVVNSILREGLTIMGWVAMWRPIDILLYSWWPLFRARSMNAKLANVEVEFSYT